MIKCFLIYSFLSCSDAIDVARNDIEVILSQSDTLDSEFIFCDLFLASFQNNFPLIKQFGRELRPKAFSDAKKFLRCLEGTHSITERTTRKRS